MCAAGSSRRGGAFTLIELLVVIAIISLLVAMLMPSLREAKMLAKQSICLANQRNIISSLVVYGNDFDDQVLPPSPAPWWNAAQTFICWQGYPVGIAGDHWGPSWIHFGKLYETRVIPSPKALFCPANDKYPHVYPAGWGDLTMWPEDDDSGWNIHPLQKKPCGYLYGVFGQNNFASGLTMPQLKLSEMHSRALVTDIFVGHRWKGQELPIWPHKGGLCAAYGDGSASFFRVSDAMIDEAAMVSTWDNAYGDHYTFCMFKLLSGDARYIDAFSGPAVALARGSGRRRTLRRRGPGGVFFAPRLAGVAAGAHNVLGAIGAHVASKEPHG